MYGLKTIHQLNAENVEAQRIMAKHNGQGAGEAAPPGPRLAAAERTRIAQENIARILNGAKG